MDNTKTTLLKNIIFKKENTENNKTLMLKNIIFKKDIENNYCSPKKYNSPNAKDVPLPNFDEDNFFC